MLLLSLKTSTRLGCSLVWYTHNYPHLITHYFNIHFCMAWIYETSLVVLTICQLENHQTQTYIIIVWGKIFLITKPSSTIIEPDHLCFSFFLDTNIHIWYQMSLFLHNEKFMWVGFQKFIKTKTYLQAQKALREVFTNHLLIRSSHCGI